MSTTTASPSTQTTPAPAPSGSWRSSRVLWAGAAMVIGQLAFRAWVNYSSWFTGDDFMFISRTINGGTALTSVIEPHGGHVMPAGMYLSWLSNFISPYDYRVNATMLMVMQVLASVGCLVLLVRLFGARIGILPPLALYLFCSIGVPVTIWWAAGVNQIPLQIALFWGLAAHVEYLRTRRTRHLLVAMAWLLLGLVFFEKTILVLGAFAIVTLGYFAHGSFWTRLATVWREYRPAALTYVVLGLGYLAVYTALALNFDPGDAGNDELGAVVSNMVFRGYLPAMAGGPLQWSTIDQFSLPHPGDAIVLTSIVVCGLVLREIYRNRSRSLRAWFLPAFFLLCDIVLVLAGRVSFVGTLISLDPRYQGELPAVTSIALACATMGILGAREAPERRGHSELLDHPRRVTVAMMAVVALSLVSSVQYATNWSSNLRGLAYFDTLRGDLSAAPEPVTLMDHPVPGYILWELVHPANLLSHVLKPYDDKTVYRDVATDHLNMVDSEGRIVPVVIPPTRHSVPGSREGCGHLVDDQERTIPLDGPVAFGGWWVRLGYLSSGSSPVIVTAGNATYGTTVEPGVHALYFKGGSDFDSVEVSGLVDGVTLCTDDVSVGRPVPASDFEGATP